MSLKSEAEQLIEHIQGARLLRAQYFDRDLFGEPVWDILLDLYKAELSQQRVTVTSASIASGVPPTTALRWLGTMDKVGLLQRTPDPTDGRRIFVRLTRAAVTAMDVLFEALLVRTAALQLGRRTD